jgi:tetratricopeptide (TPR) repeat protein
MLNNLGVVAHLQGDHPAAVARYEEALAIFRETGERTCELPGLGNLAGAQIGLGDYAAAAANLRQAIAWAGPAGHFALSMIYCYLAESLCGQGKTADALEAARGSGSHRAFTDWRYIFMRYRLADLDLSASLEAIRVTLSRAGLYKS